MTENNRVKMQIIAVLKPLINRIMDYGVPKNIIINANNNIAINGTEIGDYRLASNFDVTDDNILRFSYNGKKRFVEFGYSGFEHVNRVKKVLETTENLYSKEIFNEDKNNSSGRW